jgi:hypothetical protein
MDELSEYVMGLWVYDCNIRDDGAHVQVHLGTRPRAIGIFAFDSDLSMAACESRQKVKNLVVMLRDGTKNVNLVVTLRDGTPPQFDAGERAWQMSSITFLPHTHCSGMTAWGSGEIPKRNRRAMESCASLRQYSWSDMGVMSHRRVYLMEQAFNLGGPKPESVQASLSLNSLRMRSSMTAVSKRWRRNLRSTSAQCSKIRCGWSGRSRHSSSPYSASAC